MVSERTFSPMNAILCKMHYLVFTNVFRKKKKKKEKFYAKLYVRPCRQVIIAIHTLLCHTPMCVTFIIFSAI